MLNWILQEKKMPDAYNELSWSALFFFASLAELKIEQESIPLKNFEKT